VAGLRLGIVCLILAAIGLTTRGDIFAIRSRNNGVGDLVIKLGGPHEFVVRQSPGGVMERAAVSKRREQG